METFEVIKAFVLEWYPVALGILGTIGAVAGIVLTVYLKIKPVWEGLKDKLDELKSNTTPDNLKQTLDDKLKSSDINIRIAELQDKINNPLTSETSRKVFTQELQVLIEIKTKLDNGLEVVDSAEDKLNF